MPDGEQVEVRCAAPMRWAPYVSAAVEFGLWAFLTPEERERAIETERARVARVEAEIDGISRFDSTARRFDASRASEGYSTRTTMTMAAGGVAAVGGGGGGGGRRRDGGVRQFAVDDVAEEAPPTTRSVGRRADGITCGGSTVHVAAGERVGSGRADAVDRAFRANEEWLAANFKDATVAEDRAAYGRRRGRPEAHKPSACGPASPRAGIVRL